MAAYSEVVRQITVRAREDGVAQTSRALQTLGEHTKTAASIIRYSLEAQSESFERFERRAALSAARFVTRWAGIAGVVIAGFAAVQFARRKAREEMDSLVEIGAGAARAGLGTTMFQQFTTQAGALRLEVSELAGALEALRGATTERLSQVSSLRTRLLDQAAFGTSLPGASAAVAAFEGARSQEERLRVLLATMAQLEAAGQRLAALDLAEAAFGSGSRLVQRLRDGQVSFEEFRASVLAANDSIVPTETIRRAEELRQRIDAAASAVSDSLKPVWQDIVTTGLGIVGIGVRITEAIAAAGTQAGRLYVTLRDIASLGFGNVQRLLNERGLAASDAASEASQRLGGRFGAGLGDEFARRMGESALGAQLRDRAGEYQRRLGGGRASIAAIWSAAPSIPRPIDVDQNWLTAQRDRFAARGSGSSRDTYDYEGQLFQSITRRTEALRLETQHFGEGERALARYRAEQELLSTAQQWGLQLTDELRARIAQAANGFAEAEDRLRGLRQAQEDWNQLARFAGQNLSSFFSDIVAGGRSAERAIENLVKRLADAALQAALLGDGPLAGLFGTRGQNGQPGGLIGTLFGAVRGMFGFANGGYTGQGHRHEPAGIVHRGEFVINAAATSRHRALLEAINESRPLRGYADGGFVGGGAVAASNTVNFAPVINVAMPENARPGDGERFGQEIARPLRDMVRNEIATQFGAARRVGGALNAI